MTINRNFKDFKFQHKRNQNQVLFVSQKIKSDQEILNLIDNFLIERNSFIFESVEKGIIRGRYTIFGKNPDKIWEFNNKNSLEPLEISSVYNFFVLATNTSAFSSKINVKELIGCV